MIEHVACASEMDGSVYVHIRAHLPDSWLSWSATWIINRRQIYYIKVTLIPLRDLLLDRIKHHLMEARSG